MYKTLISDIEKRKNYAKRYVSITIFSFIIFTIYLIYKYIVVKEVDTSIDSVVLILVIVALLKSMYVIRYCNKKEDDVKWLLENGKLIENVDYKLENVFIGRRGMLFGTRISTKYKDEITGKSFIIKGEPMFFNLNNKNKIASLWIDPNNIERHFLSFKIYNKSDEEQMSEYDKEKIEHQKKLGFNLMMGIMFTLLIFVCIVMGLFLFSVREYL